MGVSHVFKILQNGTKSRNASLNYSDPEKTSFSY